MKRHSGIKSVRHKSDINVLQISLAKRICRKSNRKYKERMFRSCNRIERKSFKNDNDGLCFIL